MVSRNVRKVTLAMVGSGVWGANYIKTISTLKSCTLPEKYIVTRNYRDLSKYEDIEGIIIASPPSTHFEIAQYFIEKRMPVLIEKPLGLSYKDAEALLYLQNRMKSIAMVGHVYEFHPAFQALRREVVRWHDIRYITSEGMNRGPVRDDVSALWDWAPHDVGMIISLLDELPTRVACWSQASRSNLVDTEVCSFSLTFSSGINSISRVGWLSPTKKRRLTVIGKNRAIVFDDLEEHKLTVFSLTAEHPIIKYLKYISVFPLTQEVEAFVNFIRVKRNPLTNLSHGVNVIKVIELLEKSLSLDGKRLPLRN